ncbi:MAG: hypothetical protein Q9200_007150 [Gallowayella weberi]
MVDVECTTDNHCGNPDEHGLTPCQEGFGLCHKIPPPTCAEGAGSANGRTIGYYQASNTRDRLCNRISPAHLDIEGLTHLYFAFAKISPTTYEVVVDNPADVDLYLPFTKLQSSTLQTCIAIGGFDFSDPGPTRTTWSDLAANSGKRTAFILSCKNFMAKYGFQGVDIDWEYPGTSERGGTRADTANFVIHVREMKVSFGTQYGLSLTLAPDYWYLRGFDAKAMEPHVDMFGFMAYDLHGFWDADLKSMFGMSSLQQASLSFWDPVDPIPGLLPAPGPPPGSDNDDDDDDDGEGHDDDDTFPPPPPPPPGGGDDPKSSRTNSCTKSAVTDYFVSCRSATSGSEDCRTTSSKIVSGCDVKATATTTRDSCPLITLDPNEDQGEDGSDADIPGLSLSGGNPLRTSTLRPRPHIQTSRLDLLSTTNHGTSGADIEKVTLPSEELASRPLHDGGSSQPNTVRKTIQKRGFRTTTPSTQYTPSTRTPNSARPPSNTAITKRPFDIPTNFEPGQWTQLHLHAFRRKPSTSRTPMNTSRAEFICGEYKAWCAPDGLAYSQASMSRSSRRFAPSGVTWALAGATWS